jgi:hypothetical protein
MSSCSSTMTSLLTSFGVHFALLKFINLRIPEQNIEHGFVKMRIGHQLINHDKLTYPLELDAAVVLVNFAKGATSFSVKDRLASAHNHF